MDGEGIRRDGDPGVSGYVWSGWRGYGVTEGGYMCGYCPSNEYAASAGSIGRNVL